jgi:peptidoglycan/xylan/chitin deacetylase (PgdA/CDA1 family)
MGKESINLTFHGVGDHERALDPGEQAVWLSAGQLASALDRAAGCTEVRITFDDGNASDLELALPALRARGLSATFFVVAGRLGEPGFLDASAVRELAAAGMTIGCHGMLHRRWRGLDEGALLEELVDARRVLEDVVRRPVAQAACPFGAYDRRVLRALRRCGYERVFTSDRGTARSDAWVQARNTVRRGEVDGLFERIASCGRHPSQALSRHAKLAVKRWR